MRLYGSVISNMEPLIVDVNVLLSSLISRGNSFQIFFFNRILKKFDFVAPKYLIEELAKHKNKLMQKSILPYFIIQSDFEFVLEKIKFISESGYEDKIEEAKIILKEHQKDVPYLALALKFNCNIFSGDKIFKQLCPEKVKTPKELLQELFN